MNLLSGADNLQCPLSVLERVRIIEVFFIENIWGVCRDQGNCP